MTWALTRDCSKWWTETALGFTGYQPCKVHRHALGVDWGYRPPQQAQTSPGMDWVYTQLMDLNGVGVYWG